ncbi:hypothetical protein [Flavobacterium sp.]|uniref:hypothetical protein n=1 Tax=Flavobacterium sp. TaxID=239 RepID=UPI001B3D086D|nr:hypothetical protein [Flavobacterium sp.]MBP6127408.1 hypothetical protein [Flavobacterium sp.]
MAYTDYNSVEFNSLISIVRPIERHYGAMFFRSAYIQSRGNDFINSPATTMISVDATNDIDSLFDKNYINFLNKIEKEYHLCNNDYSLQIVKNKFSKIYSELIAFDFNKMSVEFTFDNTLIFSLDKNNNKYILQYFIDFDPNEEDDVEIIFSNISNNDNYSIETRYSKLSKVLSKELLSYELA